VDKKSTIAIVILAAGESSRMGERIKQILPWKDSNLLGNALAQAKNTIADASFVVLGAYDEIIKAEVEFEANTVIQNSNWKSGMGSSIAVAMDYFISKDLNYDAVLLMLADQPKIDTNYLNKMMGNWRGNPNKIITTQYENRSGVPAIFGKEHFEVLQKLNEDFGAKDIISSNEMLVLALNPEGKEIDIDSWQSYQELLTQKNI